MSRLLPLALIVLCLAGCKSAPAPAAPAVDPATAGTITGTVTFDGTAPKPITIDMSADPACAMSSTPNTTEQLVVVDHRLANVYVYLKAGAPSSSAPAGSPPVVLDQKGCRYVPHVLAVQQGGSVEFRNSDPTTHNVHIVSDSGSQAVDLTEMPMGAPTTHTFTTPQTMQSVRCNNHPWMQALLNVAPNPWFAVTGTDGSFTLRTLPPGTYTLAAVQEKLGERDLQVTVAPKSTSNAQFSFSAK